MRHTNRSSTRALARIVSDRAAAPRSPLAARWMFKTAATRPSILTRRLAAPSRARARHDARCRRTAESLVRSRALRDDRQARSARRRRLDARASTLERSLERLERAQRVRIVRRERRVRRRRRRRRPVGRLRRAADGATAGTDARCGRGDARAGTRSSERERRERAKRRERRGRGRCDDSVAISRTVSGRDTERGDGRDDHGAGAERDLEDFEERSRDEGRAGWPRGDHARHRGRGDAV